MSCRHLKRRGGFRGSVHGFSLAVLRRFFSGVHGPAFGQPRSEDQTKLSR